MLGRWTAPVGGRRSVSLAPTDAARAGDPPGRSPARAGQSLPGATSAVPGAGGTAISPSPPPLRPVGECLPTKGDASQDPSSPGSGLKAVVLIRIAGHTSSDARLGPRRAEPKRVETVCS